jgi:hypothetical protein
VQVESEGKLFKIDDVSREIRTKKATIRDWEQQWQLRETYLEAPIKSYTAADIELFKTLKRLIVDEKIAPEMALKQLPTRKKKEAPSSTITQPARRIKSEEETEEDDEEGEPLEIELELDMEFKKQASLSVEQVMAPTTAQETPLMAAEEIPGVPAELPMETTVATSEPAFEPAHRPVEIAPAHRTVTITIDDLNRIREQAIKIKEKLR